MTDGPTPRATVVVVARDEAEHIGRALRSVLDQRVPGLEVLVVDDGSTDGTADVARSFDGVRVVANPGVGMAEGLNHALSLAGSDIVVKLDADDWHLPGSIEALVTVLERDPGIAVVGGGAHCVDVAGRRLDGHATPPTTDHVRVVSMVHCPIEHTACAYRRHVVQAVGGYQRYRGVDIVVDFDLWVRLLRAGHRIEGISDVVAVHVISPASVTNERSEMGNERGRTVRTAARREWSHELCTMRRTRELGRGVVAWRGEVAASDQYCYVLARLVNLLVTDREYRQAAAVLAAAASLGPHTIVRGTVRGALGRRRQRRARGWYGASDVARFVRGK
jgi:glycosyltransferase involved in cell wall biosynthesis